MTTIHDITASTCDHLIMDPNHPGIHDKTYVKRRTHFFDVAREHRLNNKGVPLVQYTDEEHHIWKVASERLAAGHEKSACNFYLAGKQQLNLSTQRLPQLHDLSQQLERCSGFKLIPAEGLLEPRLFFEYLSDYTMPCTQFLRHPSTPEYTPEPDVIHDILGHIPTLLDKEFSEITSMVGRGVKQAAAADIPKWEKLYWFTIEFGLIEEGSDVKALGAGLLSSFEEIEHAFSTKVQRRPFDLEDVLRTEYDPTQLQDILFVVPSLKALKSAIRELI